MILEKDNNSGDVKSNSYNDDIDNINDVFICVGLHQCKRKKKKKNTRIPFLGYFCSLEECRQLKDEEMQEEEDRRVRLKC